MSRLLLCGAGACLVACGPGGRPSPATPVAAVAAAPAAVPVAPAIVVDDGGELAAFPDTMGQPLACDDVCRPKLLPECPGTGRRGKGRLVVRGLAGKLVVAFDERDYHRGGNLIEGREVDGSIVWDDLPAGPHGVSASVPLAQTVDAEYRCLPVHADRVNVYDAASLVRRERNGPTCPTGKGRITGTTTKPPKEFGEYQPPIWAIGPLGCRIESKVDAEGRFLFDAVEPGIYLVIATWNAVAAEVRVVSGAEAATVDLRPMAAEHERRELRRTECGCPRIYKFYRDRDWPIVPERRRRGF